MSKGPKFYQVRIRNAANSANALVLSSVPGGTNPYLTAAPSGDGESIDPITGKPTTGSYSVRVADPVTETNTRVVTSVLADVIARQQLIARKTIIETGVLGDGTDWVTLVVGYVTAIRLTSAITYEIGIGQSRRIEQSREIFKTATTQFPATTSIIGGPILGGFGTLVLDNGGWTFKVTQLATAPNYIQIKIVSGFDPRKITTTPPTTFATVSSAITDYENNYARPYFEPLPATSPYVTVKNIQGKFPEMRVRLIPKTIPADPTRDFVPFSEPEPSPGSWWTINRVYDNLTRSGQSSLWLPRECKNAATGADLIFAPAINDEFYVYVFAVPVSQNNPLHIYAHPVDVWEKLMIDNRIVYDGTVLPALKTLIDTAVDGNTRLALRITQSYKLADFLQQVIYGPFRLSTRLVDGKQVLFSIRTRGVTPLATITLANLRSDEATVFDLDEQTVVTTVTLKTKRIYPWSTTEKDQPNVDALLEIPAATESLENANDDMPGWNGTTSDSPTLHEVAVGDIPGQIVRDSAVPANNGPVDFDRFIADIGDEMFQRMGRGAIGCELPCLPSVTATVGNVVTLTLPHFPGALVGQSPVSRRGTSRNFQVVQRTEIPEGSTLKLVDATVTSDPVFIVGGPDVVVSGGSLVVT